VAAVVVSIVHLFKGAYDGEKRLDGRQVPQITAFLFDKGGHEDPKQLVANAGKSFQGSIVLGMGFTFDDSGEADDDTPGIPSPIATMERLIAANSQNAEVIFPYIGGKEVNDSPTHAHHRYVINFGDRTEKECWEQWPELMAIVERKVKPSRLQNNREGYRRYWWQHGEKRVELYIATVDCKWVLAVALTSNAVALSWLPAPAVFSHSLGIFALPFTAGFSAM
jgi:hypothetical protein